MGDQPGSDGEIGLWVETDQEELADAAAGVGQRLDENLGRDLCHPGQGGHLLRHPLVHVESGRLAGDEGLLSSCIVALGDDDEVGA